ncbi:MAG: polyprenyl synthetase family protein [Pseudomonadota bacterium]|nr:polyprenyl synthetase family protein [Pseudomonadota bacterium]
MTHPVALKAPPKTASLDALYALIAGDLKRVDAVILACVKNEIPLIYGVAQHIVVSGGKRIRPALTLIASQLCGYAGDRHIRLAACVEFIHTATLLHDDVVDESKLRRGQATANDIFGNKASVLVGDFLFAQAFRLMVEGGSLKVLKILSEASAVIVKGEVMQLATEGAPDTGIEEYLSVISSKTAVLFAAACELGAVLADRGEQEAALRQFGHEIGMAFQLVDDALDYAADQKSLGKTVGDDFREGKVTLPVILAYAAGNAEEKSFWNRAMGTPDQQPADFAQAQALIHKHTAIAQAIVMAEQYCSRARDALAAFPASPAKNAMIDIVDFCASRGY